MGHVAARWASKTSRQVRQATSQVYVQRVFPPWSGPVGAQQAITRRAQPCERVDVVKECGDRADLFF